MNLPRIWNLSMSVLERNKIFSIFLLFLLIFSASVTHAKSLKDKNVLSMPATWGEKNVFLNIGGQLVCPQILLYQFDQPFDHIEETYFMENYKDIRTPLDSIIKEAVMRVNEVQTDAFIHNRPLNCLKSNQKTPFPVTLKDNQIAVIFFRGLSGQIQGESFIAVVFLKEPGRFFYTTSTLQDSRQQQIWKPGLQEGEMEWFPYLYGHPPDKVTFRILNPLNTENIAENVFFLQFLYESYKELTRETLHLKDAIYERCLQEEKKERQDALAKQTDFDSYQKMLKEFEEKSSECAIYKPEEEE